jgi:hypothetical protein
MPLALTPIAPWSGSLASRQHDHGEFNPVYGEKVSASRKVSLIMLWPAQQAATSGYQPTHCTHGHRASPFTERPQG